jgi:hypothetical protein
MIFDDENYHALATKIDVPRMQHQFAEMADCIEDGDGEFVDSLLPKLIRSVI